MYTSAMPEAPQASAPAKNARIEEAGTIHGLTVDEVASLPSGSDHYRAYVGPPSRYGFVSASQFALLFTLGLREDHRVLDVGCGSLRLGRLLIPFLHSKRYFGIEPNRWLIEEGIARELGTSACDIKQPSFLYHDDFRCDLFGEKFDWIVAQSIITHCGPDLAAKLLSEAQQVLQPGGRFIFTVRHASWLSRRPIPQNGWKYPGSVQYKSREIRKMCQEAGLSVTHIPWHHPGSRWYIAALDARHLPSRADKGLLRGKVMSNEAA